MEIIIDYGLTDIFAEHYDGGMRSGDMVAKDMIAVRIGVDTRSAVVGALLFCQTAEAQNATRSDSPLLHQPSPADPWRLLCLEIRERKARAAVEGRGAAVV